MYVSPTVAEIRDNPTPGETARVVIQPHTNSVADIRQWLTANNGKIHGEAGSNLIKADLPEPQIDALCDLDGIRSVESPQDAIELN